MVRIRLRRTGAKNNPAYRVVVADQNSPREGAFIETIGHYLPTRQPSIVEIDADRARHWLGQGAQPSETVASLLRHKGILPAKIYAAPAPKTEAVVTETVVETPVFEETPIVAEAAEAEAVETEAVEVEAVKTGAESA